MTLLRITTAQTALAWHDIQANLTRFEQLLKPVANKTDLIILPEMFTTGFSMDASALAEPMNGSTMQWFEKQARDLNACVMGSFIAEEAGNYYNRFIAMLPSGEFHQYDKRHLFTLANEHIPYTAGNQILTFEYKGWTIAPFVCYDLRFPVWTRNTQGYDLLIFVANWPEPRRLHWKALLKARAIENQAYTVGVNRVGEDGNGLNYTGDTCVTNYNGETLYEVKNIEAIHTMTIEKEAQEVFRKKLAFLKDKGKFKYE